MKPEDDIEYIVNSGSQFNVLRALYEREKTASKGELKNETDSSKPTIDRAIRNCTEKNWVEEKSRGQYKITSAGESIVESYDNFCGTIGETQAKTKLLNNR
jgi:predicted transcriptional regulator